MKIKFISLLIVIITLAGIFSSCGENTDANIVMKIDGIDVRQDVYKYIYLNFKNDYQDYSDSQLKELTKEALVKLYSVISICNENGIDMNDDYFTDIADSSVNNSISELGSKSKFKKTLAENNMTEYVYRFFAINDQLEQELYYKLINTGKIITNTDEVIKKIESDEFICIKQVLIVGENRNTSSESYYTPAETHTNEEAQIIAEKVRTKAINGEDFDQLIVNYGESLYMMENVNGYYLCHGMWDNENEIAAFNLEVDEVSEVIESAAGYSVFKRYNKDMNYVNNNISTIIETYAQAQYTLIIEERLSLIGSENHPIEFTEEFENIKF